MEDGVGNESAVLTVASSMQSAQESYRKPKASGWFLFQREFCFQCDYPLVGEPYPNVLKIDGFVAAGLGQHITHLLR